LRLGLPKPDFDCTATTQAKTLISQLGPPVQRPYLSGRLLFRHWL
jgi:hypothetical protein